MRLLPQSLYGRLALVLFGGLLVAQLLSAAINFAERDQLLARTTGLQSATRIADIVKLLDSVGGAERQRIAGIFNAPPLLVALGGTQVAGSATSLGTPHALMFSTVLRAALGDDRPFTVGSEAMPGNDAPGFGPGYGRAMMEGRLPKEGHMPMAGMQRLVPPGVRFIVQVHLRDGSLASFDTRVPRDSANLPLRLVLTLLVLLAAVLLLSLVAVRWVTRPLKVLASAAEALGRDIRHPPLPENGPTEVRRAAHAFNTMQDRLVRFIDGRARVLAAMSHDLKTPITRMRLRADLLEDDELRTRFEKDLKEMEAMVAQSLDFMRGLGGEARQAIDMNALIESLQSDQAEMGRTVSVTGRAGAPLAGMPRLLKRCLANLLDNAVLYGEAAQVHIEDSADILTIRVRDSGPGIPPAELERVFEPFHRLETSRNRGTGGTGLGLAIARDIARAHGGDIRLRNHESGGLEAELTLARRHTPPPAPESGASPQKEPP